MKNSIQFKYDTELNHNFTINNNLSLYDEQLKSFDIASDEYVKSDNNWGDDLNILINYISNSYSQQRLPIRILYAGCGSGRLLSKLINIEYVGEIVAIDFSKKMIKLSEQTIKYNTNSYKVKFINDDFMTIDQSVELFDIIICLNNTLGNIVNRDGTEITNIRKACLVHFNKLLIGSGLLFTTVYNAKHFNESIFYSKFLRLLSMESNFKSNDYYFRFKRKYYPSHYFYSHWFTESELNNLNNYANFYNDMIIDLDNRLISISRKK